MPAQKGHHHAPEVGDCVERLLPQAALRERVGERQGHQRENCECGHCCGDLRRGVAQKLAWPRGEDAHERHPQATTSARTPPAAALSSPSRRLLKGEASWRRRRSGAFTAAMTTPVTTTIDEVTV